MHLHSQSKGGRLAPKVSTILLTVSLILVSSHGIESIVKQQQQQQQQSQAQQSQQQRSDDIPLQPQQNSQNQNAYSSHNQQQQASVSAAVGQSSAVPAGSSQQGGQQSVAPSQSASGRPSASTGALDSMSSYAPAGSSGTQKQVSSYMDNMAAAASNPEQSYQAAAQSVNMALANSGIFGSNSYAPQQQQQQQQPAQQQGAASGQQGSQSGLNPLHYFYYPAKENGQNVAPGSSTAVPNKQQDMMANSASNQYQSMASYPTYADQFNSYASAGLGTPDAAASSQDPSYLPQPMDQQQQSNQMYNQAGQQSQNSQQQQPMINGSPQQQQQPSQQYGSSDLSAYGSNQLQASPSTISFNGPTSGQASGQQSGSMMPQMGQNNGADYLNSHMGGHQQQQQQMGGPSSQAAPQNSYQNSLFNQLASGGDLSTSNFGNNAGGLSSIASYMPPSSQPSNGQQQPQASQQHDIFASGLLSGQFNSAASQLSPASIAPPSQQQSQQQSQTSSSSLFSGASSLFGSANPQQQQHQQNSLFGNGVGVNGAHNYLSSFLTPQQYQQLAGQQLSAMGSEQSPLAISAANSLQQQQQQPLGSTASPANQIASSSGSGKRFGLGSLVMPMLALAGLSLLIPTMNNLVPVVGRRKRSIVEEKASASNRQQQIQHDSMNGAHQILKENSIGEYMDKIERYYSIYKNAVESDDCLNRLICEFGDAVKDVTGKSAVMTMLEKVVPNWMTGKMHLFKEAALSTGSNGKEKCKKYVCQSSRQQK